MQRHPENVTMELTLAEQDLILQLREIPSYEQLQGIPGLTSVTDRIRYLVALENHTFYLAGMAAGLSKTKDLPRKE